MVTTRHDIVLTERGSRKVRKAIDSIGKSSTKASAGVQLLRRALGTVAVAAGLREIIKLTDSYTNLQNRLRTVTTTTKNLTDTTKSLLDISVATRSGFRETAEVYTRTALATKNLGISQKETLQFTKSLNEAVILSGAGAVEARAGLIQLSQGLASNTLRGDELRSVLEQLPVVADVIAEGMNITRGELRELGKEGKISAEAIFLAFKKARVELAERFAKTVPTIGQALTVLTNQFTFFLGELNTASGVASGFAKALITISQNIAKLTIAFAAVGSILLAKFFNKLIKGFIASTAAQREFTAAVVKGNVVLLGSGTAAKQKATFDLNAAKAQSALTATKLKDITATVASIRVTLVLVEAQHAEALAQLNMAKGIAATTGVRNGLTKAMIAEGVAHKSLLNHKRLLTKAELDLAFVTAANTAAIAGNVGAQTALQAALARTTFLARAAGVAMVGLRNALAFLGGPLGLILLASLALGVMATRTKEATDEIANYAEETKEVNKLLDAQKVKTIAQADALIAEANARIKNNKQLLKELEFRAEIARLVITQQLLNFQEKDRPNILTPSNTGFASGELAFFDEKAGLDKELAAVNLIFDKIEALKDLIGDDDDVVGSLIGVKGVLEGEKEKKFAKFLQGIQDEIDLLGKLGDAREQHNILLDAEKSLNRDLTLTEEQQLAAKFQTLLVLERETDLLDDLRQPHRDLIQDLETLETLWNRGALSLDEYTRKLDELRIGFAELDNSVNGGLRLGIARFTEDVRDIGSVVSDIVVKSFEDLSSAVAEFATTGVFNIKKFFSELFKSLVKLAVNRIFLFLLDRFLPGSGSLLGAVTGGGGGGGGLGGGSDGNGGTFAHGGQFGVSPSSSLGTLSGIDNRLVAFAARDGETVTVTPPGGAPPGSGGGAVIVQNTFQFAIEGGDNDEELTERIQAIVIQTAPIIVDASAARAAEERVEQLLRRRL